VKPFAVRLARRHAVQRAKVGLDGVFLRGLDTLRSALAAGPVIIAANHVCWWDGLMMLMIDEAVRADARVIVDKASLDRVPWLPWIGAIAVDRSSGPSALVGVRRAARHLDGPGRSVWIFPQGRERPAHLRPLDVRSGVELLQRASRAPVVPVALGYPFRDRHVPAGVAAVGAPVPAGPDLLARLERALVAELDAIDVDADRGALAGAWLAPSAGPVQDGLGARVLAWFARVMGAQRG
jgi:1-acyl-sn-glycerol-3-phosphate acyltransferase